MQTQVLERSNLARNSLAQPRSSQGTEGGPAVIAWPMRLRSCCINLKLRWDDKKHLVALAAVSYVAKGEKKPTTLGTIKIEADTSTSLEKRLVKFSTLKITEANFQTLSKEQTREIISKIEESIPETDRIISLDRVLVRGQKSDHSENVEGLKSDPPTIFLSRKPAILLSIDGDPIWSPIKDNELSLQSIPTGISSNTIRPVFTTSVTTPTG